MMYILNKLQPKEALNFTRFGSNTSLSDIEIPEAAHNRQKTDKYFLYVLIGCAVLLIPFLIYTLCYSDIRRLNGYDNCGNICGEKNVKYDQWDCTGKDMTDKPVHKNGTCESDISKDFLADFRKELKEMYHDLKFNTTHPDTLSDEGHIYSMSLYIEKIGPTIALSSFLSLGYCVLMVILFRYTTAVLVWGFLILPWTCLLLLTFILWIIVTNDDKPHHGLMGLATFLSIVELILLSIMIFLRKRIRLVTMLFKESVKAIFDMSSIFVVPAMAIFVVAIIAIAFLVSTNYIRTSGILTETVGGALDYVWNGPMYVTFFFNVIMAYWAIKFVARIQHMTISGAVAKWYFTENKELLGSPILTSALITFKFHLGTAALGTSIITLVKVFGHLMDILMKTCRLKCLFECCMAYLEESLKAFTKYAFIITAMHGTPFFTSGRQVAKLIELNLCNTTVVKCTGDFVLGMARLLVVCLSLLTTWILLLKIKDNEFWFYSYLIVFGFALICSYIILGTLQTAVNTMILCLCEDFLMNDGTNRPYAMPRGFMEFVETSKKVFAKKIQEKGLPTI